MEEGPWTIECYVFCLLFPTTLVRNAPPQSGLRPASSARMGSFSQIIVVLLCYLWISISFSTFFSKPVKKNPYTTKALLFYVLVSHANPKNSTGLSLSVEFFPSTPFSKRFQPLLWHLKTWLSLAFPGISPQAFQTLWKIFCSRGGGCGKQERGRAPGFSRVSAPFGLIFCFFHRLQPVFHMIYPQLWKQLWINLRICSLQVSVFYLLCR